MFKSACTSETYLNHISSLMCKRFRATAPGHDFNSERRACCNFQRPWRTKHQEVTLAMVTVNYLTPVLAVGDQQHHFALAVPRRGPQRQMVAHPLPHTVVVQATVASRQIFPGPLVGEHMVASNSAKGPTGKHI